MGSERFGGGGNAVGELKARETERVSIALRPSIDTCSSFISKKDEVRVANASEPAFWNKMPDAKLCRRASELSNFDDEDAHRDLNIASQSTSQRNSAKTARNCSGYSKRSRVAQMEVSLNETGGCDIKGVSKEIGSSPAKCNSAEKTQMAKQKHNLNGKRGDKRNGKVQKSKCDSFSLKAGLVSFSSAAGGNNILGVYGSKPETSDVTKHVDELSLNELLDGTCKFPGSSKDKGKKATNLNDNLLHPVREACSVLRLRKNVRTQNSAESDSSHNLKVSTCLVSSGSSVASRYDADKTDIYATNLSSCNKDSGSNLRSPGDMLEFPLCQPKDILERLALPPPKDLEFLLLDAAKPAAASKNNSDLRFGKTVSHRSGLPPFTWSHASNGHCKSNSDAIKSSTTRNICQGRWVKIRNPATFLGATDDFLADLPSLTYDNSLVPSGGQNSHTSEYENAHASTSFTSFTDGLSSSATGVAPSEVPPDGHSPRLLAAAQTLCDIATYSFKQNPHGLIRWPKKPSQKAMRACKLNSIEKSEKVFAAPKPRMGSESLVNNGDDVLPSKKIKLSLNERSDDFSETSTTRTGQVHWSTPRSNRSSPSKLLKDSVSAAKTYNANIVKKSCLMPPSTRVLDNTCTSQQKPRKIMSMDWNRVGGKLGKEREPKADELENWQENARKWKHNKGDTCTILAVAATSGSRFTARSRWRIYPCVDVKAAEYTRAGNCLMEYGI
ncbi:hypothetical protein RJ640_018969 [Escallonia rubra]|uniref:Uncharacterized protein n=1 Tax=Escallonia rubra TaxID=112253 RepID=A0AA88RKJ8_9ASTE|nr:hypothetical protein RJ640_018969 [Escallonia rubra]